MNGYPRNGRGAFSLLSVISIVAISAVTCLTGMVGCVSPGGGGSGGTNAPVVLISTNWLPEVEFAVQASAELGIPFAIKADTNAIPYLRAAAEVINVAINNGNYSPADLEGAITNISIKEIRSENWYSLINGALKLYELTFGQHVADNLDQAVWAKPILQALASGILEAVNNPAAAKKFGLPKPRAAVGNGTNGKYANDGMNERTRWCPVIRQAADYTRRFTDVTWT